MSRKDSQLPWRVIAISVLLFAALASAGWFIFGPRGPGESPSDPDQGVDGAGGTAATAAEQTAAPSIDPQAASSPIAAETVDPTTPEGRAALAAARADAGTMDLQLYLIVPSLERLIPVSRTVAAPPTLDGQIQRAVEELINWAGTSTISPVAPEARIRETWVSPGGIAYLDFEPSLYDFSGGGSLGELHTIYGIVATLTESFPEIVAVQFLIDGERKETLAGHVDLSRPLLPSDEWVLIEPGNRQIQQSDEPR
jgi:hypothetical protein